MKTFLKILKIILEIVLAILTLGFAYVVLTKKKNAKIYDHTNKIKNNVDKEIKNSDDKRRDLRNSRSKIVNGKNR